jgi:hypothetical protein
MFQGVLAEISSHPAPCPSSVYMTRHGSSLISAEDSAPSRGPVASDFVTGRFGRSSLGHGRRQFEGGRETLEEPRWKNLTCQTDPLIVQFKYRHCSFSMPVFVTFFDAIFANWLIPEKWTHQRWLNHSGPIRPGGLSRKQSHGSTGLGGARRSIYYFAASLKTFPSCISA